MKTNDGKTYKVNFFVSMTNPNRIYVIIDDISMVEAMQMAMDENAMHKITYMKRNYINCKMIAISNENNRPKLSASYEYVEENQI